MEGTGWEHFGGEAGGPPEYFVEVAVVGFEVAAFFTCFALALVFTFAEGGEEGFPRLTVGGGVGVGWGCHGGLSGGIKDRAVRGQGIVGG